MKKQIADQLAQVLSDERGATTLSLLRLMELFSDRPAASTADPKPAGPAVVGIWQEQSSERGARFVRGESSKGEQDWKLWADVEEIPPKGRKKRTILFGESVARGYLYDPSFNPATTLSAILDEASGSTVELIDLARSDILIDELQKLIKDSLVLQPDAMVVFAGNNWSPQAFQVLAPVVTKMLADGADMTAISRLIARQIRVITESFADWLGTFSKRAGVPIVVLIPEFNLVDWQPVTYPAAPFLPKGRNARWFEVRAAVERALAAKDFAKVRTLAGELRELDGGVTMAGAAFDAAAQLGLGAPPAEARKLYETIRDAEIWRPVQNTPRTFSVVQNGLREAGARAGLKLVDLPKRFEEYTGSLPDRRLFIDYCHLTAEGIRVAMACAAEPLLEVFGAKQGRNWRDLASSAPRPTPEVEGDARLLAAIHCAKLGQTFDFVRHHCAEAVKASPRLVDAFAHCLDFQTRKAPNLLCSSFELLLRSSSPSAARYLFTHGCEAKESHKPLRRAFTDAVLSVLDPIDPSIGERNRALKHDIHGVTKDGVDLLQLAYSEEGICSESNPSDHHRSNQPESHFVLFCKAPTQLELQLTCRIPEGEGEVSVRLNGSVVGTVRAGRKWTTARISVEREATVEGTNVLDLRWPLPSNLGQDGFAQMKRSLELGLTPELCPVLGELHSLTAFAS